MGTGSFPGVESGQGVMLTPHPLLVPRSKKQSRAIPLLSLRAFVAYKKGETYQTIVVKKWQGANNCNEKIQNFIHSHPMPISAVCSEVMFLFVFTLIFT
jgi:hypothetical protein